jgi:cell division initiation protein
MNRITPLDIQKHKFNTRFRGFDINEVDTFLDFIADEMEDLIRTHQQLRGEIKKKEGEIGEYKKREAILKETLISAQKAINEIKSSAEKEANLIISEAQIQADKIIHGARKRVSQLIDEIDDLKKQRIRFEAALRSEIEIHTKMLEAKNNKEEELANFDQQLKFMKKS